MPKRATSTSYNGSKANRPGRLPANADAMFQKAMRHRALNAKALKRIDSMLTEPDTASEDFKWAWGQAADRGFGKPPQSVDHTTGGEAMSALLALPPESTP